MARVVVAAFGNVLRRDDGFAVAVLEQLAAGPVPDGVTLRDVGIGGIHLVQDLLGEPADGLVLLDSVHLDRHPGTVVVVEPDVPDVNEMSVMQRRDELADMHYATPDRALLLLRALGALPPVVRTVGCEPVDVDTPQHGLTDTVAAAVTPPCVEVRRLVGEMGVPWPDPAPAS
jgi:hydrogenase maturation protease